MTQAEIACKQIKPPWKWQARWLLNAFASCLQAPGAWAHAPLLERLAELKVPVTFIYGESDWMNPAAGQAVAQKLDQIRARKVGGACTLDVP